MQEISHSTPNPIIKMRKLLSTSLLVAVAFAASAQDATITLHDGTQKIHKEIYGQFAEHLGT